MDEVTGSHFLAHIWLTIPHRIAQMSLKRYQSLPEKYTLTCLMGSNALLQAQLLFEPLHFDITKKLSLSFGDYCRAPRFRTLPPSSGLHV